MHLTARAGGSHGSFVAGIVTAHHGRVCVAGSVGIGCGIAGRESAGVAAPFAGLPSFRLQALDVLDIARIAQPELHADERFTALDAEHVPRFRLGQQFRNGSLRQAQHGFAENLQLTNRQKLETL